LDKDKEYPLILAALKKSFDREREKVAEEMKFKEDFLNNLKPEHSKRLDDELKVYKFYPEHSTKDLKGSRVPKVNRYYGNAYKIFPTAPADPQHDLPVPGSSNGNASATAPATTTATTGFTFDGNTSFTPTFGNGGGFTFNPTTAASSSVKMLDIKGPSILKDSGSSSTASSGFSIPVGGFNIGSTSFVPPASGVGGFVFKPPTAEDNANKWKCAACEEMNDNSKNSCDTCMSAKPK